MIDTHSDQCACAKCQLDLLARVDLTGTELVKAEILDTMIDMVEAGELSAQAVVKFECDNTISRELYEEIKVKRAQKPSYATVMAAHEAKKPPPWKDYVPGHGWPEIPS